MKLEFKGIVQSRSYEIVVDMDSIGCGKLGHTSAVKG
jgi:hypothetical protein